MIRHFLIALYSSFFILQHVVCGSLTDRNSENISVISSLKNIRSLVLGGRWYRLKVHVHAQGEEGSKIKKPESTYVIDDPYWAVFNKYFTPATYLLDPISCEFFSKVHFNKLEAKYWTYWTDFNKYFTPGSYLMDPNHTLCEMCSNTEFFLVRIFPHSDWIRRDSKIRSVSPYSVWMQENTDQKKLRLWIVFTQRHELFSRVRLKYLEAK